MTRRAYLLILLLELAIAGAIIFAYVERLSLIVTGHIVPSVTGADNLVGELISLLITVMLLSLVWIITHNRFMGKWGSYGIVASLSTLYIGLLYSISDMGGGALARPELLIIVIGSTFIKIRYLFRNGFDDPGLSGLMVYILVYYCSILFSIIFVVSIYDPAGPTSIHFPSQILEYQDTLAALIYFCIIGIIMPLAGIRIPHLHTEGGRKGYLLGRERIVDSVTG